MDDEEKIDGFYIACLKEYLKLFYEDTKIRDLNNMPKIRLSKTLQALDDPQKYIGIGLCYCMEKLQKKFLHEGKNVQEITIKDVRNFIKEKYTPKNKYKGAEK